MKPHRWAEIIRAYADGYPLQYRVVDEEENYASSWFDVLEDEDRFDSPNFNLPDAEWRIKPQEIRFRVALMRDKEKGDYFTESFDSQEEFEQSWTYSSASVEFVRWLTDWMEYSHESQ